MIMKKQNINQGEGYTLIKILVEGCTDRGKQMFKDALLEAERRGFDEGFKQGFNDCKQMVEKGEHSHCCIISGKELINQTEEK